MGSDYNKLTLQGDARLWGEPPTFSGETSRNI